MFMGFEFEVTLIIYLFFILIFLLYMIYSLEGINRGIWYIINDGSQTEKKKLDKITKIIKED